MTEAKPRRRWHLRVSLEAALDRHRTICQPRGHCGPPMNVALYDDMGWPWQGVADCGTCGNTYQAEDREEAA
jgi:hypothetical protein